MSHDDDDLNALKSFTPDGSGLDRDALMFEAGRASAPSPARARLLAGVLALTQTLTLGLLLFPSGAAPVPAPGESAPPPPASEQGPPQPLSPLLLTGIERRLPESEPPLPTDEMVPAEPPLRLFDHSSLLSLE